MDYKSISIECMQQFCCSSDKRTDAVEKVAEYFVHVHTVPDGDDDDLSARQYACQRWEYSLQQAKLFEKVMLQALINHRTRTWMTTLFHTLFKQQDHQQQETNTSETTCQD